MRIPVNQCDEEQANLKHIFEEESGLIEKVHNHSAYL